MAGCLFLFNPTVNLIDVLPDVIGYLLILKGLYKLADLNGKIKAARQKFKAAVWIASGELLVMLAASVLEATWYLVFSFVFCVLKLIYLIPAFVNLFEGISYLEMRLTNHKAQRQTVAKPRFGGVFDKPSFPTVRHILNYMRRKMLRIRYRFLSREFLLPEEMRDCAWRMPVFPHVRQIGLFIFMSQTRRVFSA